MDSDLKDTQEHLKTHFQKKYLHFDFPIRKSEKEKIIHNIRHEIYHHRYLPYIRVNIVYRKYSKLTKKIKKKVRKITLPSHHDALIYQYFGYDLSKRYEKYIKNTLLDQVVTAYRLNKHISNVNVAKEVIDYVTAQNQCWVIKGDFKHFFDNLDHKILKKQLCDLLGSDYNAAYAQMLKFMTNYRFITRDSIEKQLQRLGIKLAYRSNGDKAYINNLKEFGTLVKKGMLTLSPKNSLGIPQGTAVSAVLANIYMISFDNWVAHQMQKYNGLYRRYSDDFIIILPLSKDSYNLVRKIKEEVIKKSNCLNKLEIEHKKTKLLFYSKNRKAIYVVNDGNYRRYPLSYLGFNFDGISVSLKPQSIYKYIYRGKRTINRYLVYKNARDRFLILNGPTTKVIKFNEEGKKAYREANNTEQYRKDRVYYLAGTMKDQAFNSYHKSVVKRYLASRNIEPKSSMMAYAKKAQRIFQYKCNGKYKVVIQRQVERQVRKNQKRIGESRNINFDFEK